MFSRRKSIDSNSRSIDKIPRVGREPCARLTSHNAKKKSRSFVCPRYNICPTTQMEREVYTASNIPTTAQAALTSKIRYRQAAFAAYILENADVVILTNVIPHRKRWIRLSSRLQVLVIRQSRDFYSSISSRMKLSMTTKTMSVSSIKKTTDYGKYIMEMIRQLYSHIEKQKKSKIHPGIMFKRVLFYDTCT